MQINKDGSVVYIPQTFPKNNRPPKGANNYHNTTLSPEQEIAARLTMADQLDSYDNGHIGAINVALFKATGGKLGFTVDQSKQFKKDGINPHATTPAGTVQTGGSISKNSPQDRDNRPYESASSMTRHLSAFGATFEAQPCRPSDMWDCGGCGKRIFCLSGSDCPECKVKRNNYATGPKAIPVPASKDATSAVKKNYCRRCISSDYYLRNEYIGTGRCDKCFGYCQ
jgi:hypothetical protein